MLFKKVEALAITDGLTGLYTRTHFIERLQEEIERAKTNSIPISIAMIDIDYFKKVNDTYGHNAGDAILIHVAKILMSNIRDCDSAYRWGGEEFLMIFENYDLDRSREFLEELLDEIRALEIQSEDVVIKVTMSMGIVECEKGDFDNEALVTAANNEEEYEDVLKRRIDKYISDADARLYYGKEHGRNRIISQDVP